MYSVTTESELCKKTRVAVSQGHVFEEEIYDITEIERSMLQTFGKFIILDKDKL